MRRGLRTNFKETVHFDGVTHPVCFCSALWDAASACSALLSLKTLLCPYLHTVTVIGGSSISGRQAFLPFLAPLLLFFPLPPTAPLLLHFQQRASTQFRKHTVAARHRLGLGQQTRFTGHRTTSAFIRSSRVFAVLCDSCVSPDTFWPNCFFWPVSAAGKSGMSDQTGPRTIDALHD